MAHKDTFFMGATVWTNSQQGLSLREATFVLKTKYHRSLTDRQTSLNRFTK